jgi:tetratricopeptide (TPR) repeat protein
VDERITLLRKIGDVCSEQVKDGARAFEAYGRALREDPAREEVRDALEALAAPIDAWSKLVALLREVAEGAADPDLVRTLWIKIAGLEDGRLQNVDAAVEAYNKVLALDPGDAEALAALEGLFERTERWNDLLGVYRKRLDLAADPDVREELLSGMAEVYDERLSDPESAIATYGEMLNMDPASGRALSALDVLYARLMQAGRSGLTTLAGWGRFPLS